MTDPPPAACDLRDEPRMPVRHLIHGPTSVGFRRLFKDAHLISELALPIPPANSALLRVLYAMAASITGLDDPDLRVDEWDERRNGLLMSGGGFDPAAVDAYFDADRLRDRWYLFGGPRPFLQDPALASECPERAGINKLAFGRAAANTFVWWEHSTNAAPSPMTTDEALWHLLVLHYYGPSGKCSARRVAGKSVSNSKAGPLRRTISFHPLGESLFESLLLGVPFPDERTGQPDLSPWEKPLAGAAQPDAPFTGVRDLLTGRSRHAALLIPSPDHRYVVDAYVTLGATADPREAVDPFVILNIAADGNPYPRRADRRRALWRDLDALILDGGSSSRRPRILESWNEVPDGVRERMRIRAYGFDQDGQQVDNSWFTAVTPPVIRWLSENDQTTAYRSRVLRESAEAVAARLEFVAKLAWAEAFGPAPADGGRVKIDRKNPGPWKDAAMAAYWPAAERAFWSALTTDEDARRLFVRLALRALADAVGDAEHRQRTARALAHARVVLSSLLASAAA